MARILASFLPDCIILQLEQINTNSKEGSQIINEVGADIIREINYHEAIQGAPFILFLKSWEHFLLSLDLLE